MYTKPPYPPQYPHPGYHHHGHAHSHGMPGQPEPASNANLVKGILVGAAAAYLLTNESVQQASIRSVVKLWSLARGGVEELKERFQDAHAEILAEKEQHD
ncbi:MAG: YtxH domain-containing protein [Magnetococcales bacterium]|nr:YtxH domain-containing protein [Magnetococcales bacterium]